MISNSRLTQVIDLTGRPAIRSILNLFHRGIGKDKLGLPFLHLETDYSDSDRETLRVRIEAFLEMI